MSLSQTINLSSFTGSILDVNFTAYGYSAAPAYRLGLDSEGVEHRFEYRGGVSIDYFNVNNEVIYSSTSNIQTPADWTETSNALSSNQALYNALIGLGSYYGRIVDWNSIRGNIDHIQIIYEGGLPDLLSGGAPSLNPFSSIITLDDIDEWLGYENDTLPYVGFDAGMLTIETVPIPGAAWLLGSGLIGLVGYRRKFNKV